MNRNRTQKGSTLEGTTTCLKFLLKVSVCKIVSITLEFMKEGHITMIGTIVYKNGKMCNPTVLGLKYMIHNIN